MSTSDFNGVVYIYDLDRISSVTDKELEESILIYPNPHSDNFYIESRFQNNISIQAFDLLGHRVPLSGNNINGYKINGTSGLYTIRIEAKDQAFSQKIIKL